MAVKTTLEQLEEVQAAITQVMTSQELGGSEGRILRARLDYLTDRENVGSSLPLTLIVSGD
ncbi:hypothetical protein ACFL9T_10580 [Thermodesulfobacteriota bacterium]